MKSLQYKAKNSLEWVETPAPKIDGENQAILRPIVVARCDLDLPILQGKTLFRPPFPLGHEWIGEIVEVSPGLEEKFKKGKRFASPFQISCGSCPTCLSQLSHSCEKTTGGGNYGLGPGGKEYGGALSEFIKVPFANQMLIPFPDELDPVVWASLSDNIAEAWKLLGSHINNIKGEKVLILGGGAPSISFYTLILSISFGKATEYWDNNDTNLSLAEKLGAKVKMIDWENISSYPKNNYNLIADCSGNETAFSHGLRNLSPGGIYTTAGIYWSNKVHIPFLELYNKGASIHISRVASRESIPEMLRLSKEIGFNPSKLPTTVAKFKDAKDAWMEPAIKLVVLN